MIKKLLIGRNGETTERVKGNTKSLFTKRALESKKEQIINAYLFEPAQKTEQKLEKIIEILDSCIAGNIDGVRLEQICTGMGEDEKAFVLNFANIYLPAFKDDEKLRKSPKEMVEYLKDSTGEMMRDTGYFSFFVSALDEDGEAAGFLVGRSAHPNTVFKKCGLAEEKNNLAVTYIEYIEIAQRMQRMGVDSVLLNHIDTTMSFLGNVMGFGKTNYYLTQVNRKKDIENTDIKMRITRWQARKYNLRKIEGLKNPLSGEVELLISTQEKQEDWMPYEDLKTIIRCLHLCNGITPRKGRGESIIGTLDKKLKESIEEVTVENGMVELKKLL
ncbi:MAG: hypothetical protein ABIH83_03540 [Candidatus Micrarchaeota archaeon]